MSNPRKKDFPCLKCDMHVKKNEHAVQCSLCELWVHKTCADISDVLFQELCKQARTGGGINWTCNSCGAASFKLSKMCLEIDKKVNKLEEKVNLGDEDRENIKTNLKAVSSDVEKLKGDMKSSCSDTRKAMRAELKDQEMRKKNIVIHQLPEAPDNIKSGYERKDKDMLNLEQVLQDIGSNVTINEVKFISRLGDKKNSGRPLLVGFLSEQHRNTVLSKARNLQKSQKYSSVGIVPDLTKEQRKDEDDMIKEVEKLNSQLSEQDSLNFKYQLVGRKGEKRMIKVKIKNNQSQQSSTHRKRKGPPSPGRGEPRKRINSSLSENMRMLEDREEVEED